MTTIPALRVEGRSALRRATALEAKHRKRARAEAEQREVVEFYGSIRPHCTASFLAQALIAFSKRALNPRAPKRNKALLFRLSALNVGDPCP